MGTKCAHKAVPKRAPNWSMRLNENYHFLYFRAWAATAWILFSEPERAAFKHEMKSARFIQVILIKQQTVTLKFKRFHQKKRRKSKTLKKYENRESLGFLVSSSEDPKFCQARRNLRLWLSPKCERRQFSGKKWKVVNFSWSTFLGVPVFSACSDPLNIKK